MSLRCLSVCLLVFLGQLVVYGSPVHSVFENLIGTHESIADLLDLKEPEIGSEPPFSCVIRNINASCQRYDEVLVMDAALDVYIRILSNILQHSQNRHRMTTKTPTLLEHLSAHNRDQVELALQDFQHHMEKMKRKLNHQSHDQQDVLSKLKKIKVDDPFVQKKALAQFKEIYQAASLIGSRNCGTAHSSG